MITPVILCGGSGTRLWPLSRKSYPKQFVSLLNENSLFQETARRMVGPLFGPPVIVTGDPFRFIVTEQLSACEIAARATLIEPFGRNTAPAVLSAALILAQEDPKTPLLVAPSDHIIPDNAAFTAAVEAALPRALAGDLVSFGITPSRPETGYGYLELHPDADAKEGSPQALVKFVEKPDITSAEAMVSGGKHLWNAGIFLFTASALIKAFEDHAPEILETVHRAVSGAEKDLAFTRLAADAWDEVEDISIDYAIMERATNLAVMPFHGHWSDLGGWEAVWMESGPDEDGNVTSSSATSIGCKGSLLRSDSPGQEVVGIGLEDMLVVAMNDAVLVAPKSQSQRVKDAVQDLKARNVSQATQSPRDYRPWGWYESLVIGRRFQVKRIHVSPGASLSLQSHHHRSEHWIVVEGTAQVTVDDKVSLLTENQSVYIPLGAVHRLENPGKVPMVLIEVQTGSYFGEDDIIRYDDIYARN